jgi:hypothetical protein
MRREFVVDMSATDAKRNRASRKSVGPALSQKANAAAVSKIPIRRKSMGTGLPSAASLEKENEPNSSNVMVPPSNSSAAPDKPAVVVAPVVVPVPAPQSVVALPAAATPVAAPAPAAAAPASASSNASAAPAIAEKKVKQVAAVKAAQK